MAEVPDLDESTKAKAEFAAALGELEARATPAEVLSDRLAALAVKVIKTAAPTLNQDPQARYLLGWWHFHRYQSLPVGNDVPELDQALQLWMPFLVNNPDVFPPEIVRHYYELAAADPVSHAVELFRQYERTGQLELLHEAVSRFADIVADTPADHPNLGERLANLSHALRVRFEHTGDVNSLDEAIHASREAVQTTPADHVNRIGILANLSAVLRVRFEHTGDVNSLDEAIHASREAVQTTPADHPDLGGILANLGIALQTWFRRTGETASLNEAVIHFREAVQATPEDRPEFGMYLADLGIALQTRFQLTREETSLEEAIQVGRLAAQVTLTGPERAIRYSRLPTPTYSNSLAHIGLANKRALLVDALRRIPILSDRAGRILVTDAMYLDYLEPLTGEDRFNAIEHVFGIAQACLQSPRRLSALLSIIDTAEQNSQAITEARRVIADLELLHLFPTDQRIKLFTLLTGAAIPNSADIFSLAAGPNAPWIHSSPDPSEMFRILETLNAGPGQLPPSLVFVEHVAAQVNLDLAIELHRWAETQAASMDLQTELITVRRSLQPRLRPLISQRFTPRDARVRCSEPVVAGTSTEVEFSYVVAWDALPPIERAAPAISEVVRVLLYAEGAVVEPLTQTFRLSTDFDATSVRFRVVPAEQGTVELVFRIYLGDGQLLQEVRADLPVGEA